jgi:hypothetical protein
MTLRREAANVMWPTVDDVRTAAYFRWQRRGGLHGFDRHDWQAAEDDLLFRRNYRVAARRRLDDETQGTAPRGRRPCRFCERSGAEARFAASQVSLGGMPGITALLGGVECEECGDSSVAMAKEFARFARPFRAVALVRGLAGWPSYRWDGRWAGGSGRGPTTLRLDRPDGTAAVWHRSEAYHPLAVLKFLTRLAVALLPDEALEEFGGTIEWVSNPDHALDSRALGGLGCRVYLAPLAFGAPWLSLARRVDDQAPLPSTLVFLGVGHAVFQASVPLATGDDELDGESLRVPAIALPGDAEGVPWESPWLDVALDSPEPREGAVLELAYCGGAGPRV